METRNPVPVEPFSTDFTSVDAVRRLHAAATTSRQPVRDLIGSDDGAIAYALQTRLIETRVKAGAARIGGKIGLTSSPPVPELAGQAKLMESCGANCVYITDFGGLLMMDSVRDRMRRYHDPATEIGINAHNNLSLAIANSIVAVEVGVTRVDASLAGRGAGTGNYLSKPLSPWPICRLVPRLRSVRTSRRGRRLVRTPQDRPVRVDRETFTPGYMGVYSPVLRHAETASPRHGVDVRDIFLEGGRRGLWAVRKTSSSTVHPVR